MNAEKFHSPKDFQRLVLEDERIAPKITEIEQKINDGIVSTTIELEEDETTQSLIDASIERFFRKEARGTLLDIAKKHHPIHLDPEEIGQDIYDQIGGNLLNRKQIIDQQARLNGDMDDRINLNTRMTQSVDELRSLISRTGVSYPSIVNMVALSLEVGAGLATWSAILSSQDKVRLSVNQTINAGDRKVF